MHRKKKRKLEKLLKKLHKKKISKAQKTKLRSLDFFYNYDRIKTLSKSQSNVKKWVIPTIRDFID